MEETKTPQKNPFTVAAESKQAETKEAPKAKSDKLGYDELNHIAGQLQYRNKQLTERLQQVEAYASSLEIQNLFAYQNSLFKVVEHSEMYNVEFVSKCIDDISDIISRLHDVLLAQPKPEEDEKSEEE